MVWIEGGIREYPRAFDIGFGKRRDDLRIPFVSHPRLRQCDTGIFW